MKTIDLSPSEAYRRMSTIRRFEERVLELSTEGLVAGSVHPCIGQEAIPVGAVAALQSQDRVLSTYRGHGWALACGSNPTALLGEIVQREGGLNGGRAGSAFLSDPEIGFLGENSIVGASVPIASGVALASVTQGTNRVVLVSIGDGAMNQGATTEGMIFAAARSLPVIFLCENNGWSEMTPISVTTRGEDLTWRGEGLGIESVVVDGGDPFRVRDAVAAAAEMCRRGDGPVLLECKTVRLKGHYNNDFQHYRSKEDIAKAAAGDPIMNLVASLGATGELSEADIEAIDEEIAQIIEGATTGARKMALPNPETVLEHLYGEPVQLNPARRDQAQVMDLTYQRAINQALNDELADRRDLLVYGEDVGFAGGIFGVSRGLQIEYGSNRVFDTPISESAILGSGVGAGIEGVRTVVEIMWADFIFVALDQLINQAANVRYINRSALNVPITVRVQQGVTPGSCAQHSQSIEAIIAHVPGLKVGLPATPQDAYDMLRAAVADPDPTIIIEHRSLYQRSAAVSTGAVTQRAEGARRHRDGSHLTIFTWGAALNEVLAAAENLESEGIEATVVDLRWLRPLDTQAIASGVSDGGGRILIVHDATITGGFGAEVAAQITERHFPELAGPVRRLGTPDIRIPSAPVLQRALLPNRDRIAAAGRQVAQLKRRLTIAATLSD